MNLKVAIPAKVEPFHLPVGRALTQEEINQVLASAVSRSAIPDRSRPQNLDFEIPLASIFRVEPAPEGAAAVVCTPDPEAVDDQAVRWCQALTKLPPKSLPRSQRPIIKLLLRLPPKPTGNPAIDKGRRMILDRTLGSLWPAVVATLVDGLEGKAGSA